MKLHRAHILAGYLLAAVLVVFPLVEVGLAGWPPRPGSVAWRYGTISILTRALMTPLLGLAIASGLGLLLRQPRMVRTLAVISALVSFFLLFTSARFLLDALHMTAQVGADAVARSTLNATTIPAMFRLLVGFAATVLLAVGNWAAGEAATARQQEGIGGVAPGPAIQAGRSIPSVEHAEIV